jgi:hypothetical protein
MSKTRTTTLEGQPRRLKAVQLRLAGMTYRQIGEEMGFSEQRAWSLVQKEIQRVNRHRKEAAAEMLRLELERLDRLHAAFWEQAVAGDLDAAAFVLRLMQRRARLLGLDAPAAKGAPDPAVHITITLEQVLEARQRAEAFRKEQDREAQDAATPWPRPAGSAAAPPNGSGNPDQQG